MDKDIALPAVLSSKKFQTALVAAVVAFIAQLMGMSTTEVSAVISPLVAAILAQGAADYGKERAKIDKASPTINVTTVEAKP